MKILDYIRKRWLRSKMLNSWTIFFSDLVLMVLSTFITLETIISLFTINKAETLTFRLMIFSFAASIICMLLCNTYKGVIRHSAITESGRIGMTALLKTLFIIIFGSIFLPMLSCELLILGAVIDFLSSFFILIAYRVLMISTYHMIWNRIVTPSDRVLVYWNGKHSAPVSPDILNRMSGCILAGYLSYGKNRTLRINGSDLYAFSNQEDLCFLVNKKNIKAVLFMNRSDVEKEQDRLIRYCERLKLRMLMLPALNQLENGRIPMDNLREVRIEDLLGRSEIEINLEKIRSSLKNKVILVTGAAGSIGSELCRQLCSFEVGHLILFDAGETPMHNIRLELEDKFPQIRIEPIVGDIRNEIRLRQVFDKYHPEVVFHAAAYKHVPLMEENPCEAVYTNVHGTRLLADKAVEYGVEKFIMISTDKAVNPTNVMGASKRLAEIYVQSLGKAIKEENIQGKTQFITTRFGNVLGSNGSVIPRFREQIAHGGPVTVTHPDIIRFFMTIPEACRLVLEASVMGHTNEIFVFDMGKPMKIADMARRMIELSGLEPDKDIKIVYTGLRPGEKLYEEVLASKESTLPTLHNKIFRARVRDYDYQSVVDSYQSLIEEARKGNEMKTVQLMKQIVPEFKSQNSIYEALDNK